MTTFLRSAPARLPGGGAERVYPHVFTIEIVKPLGERAIETFKNAVTKPFASR